MALKDFCRTAPINNPVSCEDVNINWKKLAELHSVLCCLSQKKTVSNVRCIEYVVNAPTTAFTIPSEWNASSAERCDFMVFWNGQRRAYSGSSTGEFEWQIMLIAGQLQIVFNEEIGSINTPETVSVVYFERKTLLEQIDCDAAVTSC